jgi:hypothetical protein
MKLKISILLLIAGITGASIAVVLIQSKARQQERNQESQLPTAISNYSKTFKLNTSPPIWPDTKGVTNGSSTN